VIGRVGVGHACAAGDGRANLREMDKKRESKEKAKTVWWAPAALIASTSQ